MATDCIIDNWILFCYSKLREKSRYYTIFFAMLGHKLLLFLLGIVGVCLIVMGFNVTDNSLNSLLINIGAGIQSSVIFYILVVAFPIYHKNRKLAKSIYYRIHNLSYFPPIFSELIKIAKRKDPSLEFDLSKQLTDNEIDLLCAIVFTLDRIEFKTIQNGGFQPTSISVIDHIESQLKKTTDEIQNILSGLANFLDDDLVVYLNELYYDTEITVLTHGFFNTLRQLNNRDLQGFSSTFKKLYKWSNKLKEHNLKYYKSE